jgi:hypothetical protein
MGTLGGITRSDDGYFGGGITRSDDGYFGGHHAER